MEIRVLTIREPYVSPIAAGIKHYETRSYKTNYRGEIYIHTAKTTMEVPDGGEAGTMPLEVTEVIVTATISGLSLLITMGSIGICTGNCVKT